MPAMRRGVSASEERDRHACSSAIARRLSHPPSDRKGRVALDPQGLETVRLGELARREIDLGEHERRARSPP